MNKITRVHIGKVAYDIELNAQVELEKYLTAVAGTLGDDEQQINDDIEARIVDILAEQGVAAGGVVTESAVTVIKAQLGEVAAFEDDDQPQQPPTTAKRQLMRDEQHGKLAGVAEGLGVYFEVDPIWFRLLFIGLSFAGGSGIIIYIILAIVMPKATTAADRLVMAGKPATAEGIKSYYQSATDVSSVFINALRRVIQWGVKFARVVLIGLLLAAAVGLLIGGVSAVTALIAQPIDGVFPVNRLDYSLLAVGSLVGLSVIGSMFFTAQLVRDIGKSPRKKADRGWGWVTLASAVVTTGLAIGLAVPVFSGVSQRVERYEQQVRTIETSAAVTSLKLTSADRKVATYDYVQIDDNQPARVEVRSRTPLVDTSEISVTKNNKRLLIERAATPNRWCFLSTDCNEGALNVTIYAPSITDFTIDGNDTLLLNGADFTKPVRINMAGVNGYVSLDNVTAQKLALTLSSDNHAIVERSELSELVITAASASSVDLSQNTTVKKLVIDNSVQTNGHDGAVTEISVSEFKDIATLEAAVSNPDCESLVLVVPETDLEQFESAYGKQLCVDSYGLAGDYEGNGPYWLYN